MEIKGKRVTIRPVTYDDLPALCRWWNDPIVMREVRVINYKPTIREVQKTWPVLHNPKPQDIHLFIIFLEERAVGEIGYRYMDAEKQTASVDIKIGEPSLWGQGLGTEAMKLFVAYLLDELKVQNIIAEPGDWNKRSTRLFEKCGFKEIKREMVPANPVFSGGIGVTMKKNRT